MRTREDVSQSKPFQGLGMAQQGYAQPWQRQVHDLARQVGYGSVETFSGPGGMSLGLEWAGFRILTAFDYDPLTVKTHNRNLGGRCTQLDARAAQGSDLLHRAGAKVGEVALLSGGPPCQGFSKQRRGAHLGDHRNDLVLEYMRLVQEIRPRFFIFENVAIFGQKRGLAYLEAMRHGLVDYEFHPHFYDASHYGLPQTRQRFILVGKRKDVTAPFTIPEATTPIPRTVGSVLEGLPEPPDDHSDHPDYPNHQRARVSDANIHRFSHVPQGGGWVDIPFDLRIPCHKKADPSKGGWPDVYGRLAWDGQCPTITGGFDSFTRGRFGHPIHDRPITPREAARIQGFPDSFVFMGTRGDVRHQIGNVVPPPLAEAIGLSILRTLLKADGLLA